jgi:hypothetical protein
MSHHSQYWLVYVGINDVGAAYVESAFKVTALVILGVLTAVGTDALVRMTQHIISCYGNDDEDPTAESGSTNNSERLKLQKPVSKELKKLDSQIEVHEVILEVHVPSTKQILLNSPLTQSAPKIP